MWNHGGTPIIVDYVDYDYTPDDQSQGLWPNGQGQMVTMDSPTPLAANSGPVLGQVVISEVHYNPSDLNDYEFIELFNRGPSAVNLWETYGAIDYPWEIEGFEFAVGTSLQPREIVVIVSFDPDADPAKLDAFKTRYALEASPVQIMGSYGGNLPNGSEMIRLERPLPLVGLPAFTPYETVDAVRYSDEAPWPTEPDGGGDSLHRISPDTWGNDAASWSADVPSPGAVNFVDTTGPTVTALGLDAGATLGIIDSATWTTGRSAQTAPWAILDKLVLTFDEPVTAALTALGVFGIDSGSLAPTALSGLGTSTLTWTMTTGGQFLAGDRYTVVLSTAVVIV